MNDNYFSPENIDNKDFGAVDVMPYNEIPNEPIANEDIDKSMDDMPNEVGNNYKEVGNSVDNSNYTKYDFESDKEISKYIEKSNRDYEEAKEVSKLAKQSETYNDPNKWVNISRLAREERFRKARYDRTYVLEHFDELTTPEIMRTLFFEGQFVALDAPMFDLDKEKVRIRDEFMASERDFFKEMLLSDRLFCKEMMDFIRKEKIDSKKALDLAVELYERIENGTLESRDELEEMDSMSPEEREEAHLKNLIQAEKTMCIFFMMAGNPTQLELTIDKEHHKDEPPTFGPFGSGMAMKYNYEEPKKQVELEVNSGGRQITY